jgi:hypothetical protein
MEPLSDGEITLRLSKDTPADPTKEWLRALHFDITLPDSVEAIGLIDIRLGYTLSLVRFGGHFGYNVKPVWRGHHYGGKACKLLRSPLLTGWMSCGLPAIPIIGLPAKLANGLEQRWLRLLICRLRTINIRKGKDRNVATDGFFTERERSGYWNLT